MWQRPDAQTLKRKRAEIARRYRAARPPFSMAALRVKELERLFAARHGAELPDDDTGLTCARIMVHHLAAMSGDPRPRINGWLEQHAPWLAISEARAMLSDAIAKPRRWRADKLAWRLHLMAAERSRLRIRTIGAVDESKAERTRQRRARNLTAKQRQRRAQGVIPRAEYLKRSVSRAKPWEALGMSRASWYRAGKPSPETSPGTA